MAIEDDLAARRAGGTRNRIIDAAQVVFSNKGYPHAGLREIAGRAGVATSLVTKYFGTKSNLFEQALIDALAEVDFFQGERADFGALVVEVTLDRAVRMSAPAMIALSLGDAEARQVAVRVTREHILAPSARWLGEPDGVERALNMFMMTLGLAIVGRTMRDQAAPDADIATSNRMFAAALQSLVDHEAPTSALTTATAESSPRDRRARR